MCKDTTSKLFVDGVSVVFMLRFLLVAVICRVFIKLLYSIKTIVQNNGGWPIEGARAPPSHVESVF